MAIGITRFDRGRRRGECSSHPFEGPYLRSLGLSSLGRTDFYLPLTSELLTLVNPFGILLAPSVMKHWHEDMSRIQGRLAVGASRAAGGTSRANGTLGPLLGMEPNGFYADRPATSSYADPPLPWTPSATDLPLPPTVENAANILARTFVDAHVQDWCGVLHKEGEDEFALNHLRDRCAGLRGTDDEDAEVACDVCSGFAEWFVFDAEPDVAANPALAEPPICTVIVDAAGIEAESAAGDFDTASLARRWCETGITVEVTGPETVSLGEFVQLIAQVLGTSDSAVTWTASGGVITQDGLFSSREVGTFVVLATSVANENAVGSIEIEVISTLAGTYTGNSFDYDGQDTPPQAGAPDPCEVTISVSGDATLSFRQLNSTLQPENVFAIIVSETSIEGTNGRTPERTISATGRR